MSLVGLDPVAAPGIAALLDRSASELDDQSARISALLEAAGERLSATALARGAAETAREAAGDLRRRVEELMEDAGALLGELAGFVAGDVLHLWNGGAQDDMPWGTWLAGALREYRVGVFLANGGRITRLNPLPLFNNGAAGRLVVRVPGMAWLARPPATAALRGLGIAGGLFTGVVGTVDLVRQGNPVDAYRREGAGYVADVAGTAFGYSSAAFLIAPSPVTGAIMLGTGVVWLGAEAWDHREEIVAVWNTATGWTGDRLVDLGNWTGDRLVDVTDWTGDRLMDVSAWTGDRLDDLGDWTGNRLVDMGDWTGNRLEVVGDWTGNRLADVGDWTGNRLEDVGDWTGDRLDDVAFWD